MNIRRESLYCYEAYIIVMAVKFRKVSSTYKARVYTEDGYFLGEVEDAIISGNKIYGWKIKVERDSLLKKKVKGLIVPHQLVKAMGEIWIVSKAVFPTEEEELNEEIKEETKKEGKKEEKK